MDSFACDVRRTGGLLLPSQAVTLDPEALNSGHRPFEQRLRRGSGYRGLLKFTGVPALPSNLDAHVPDFSPDEVDVGMCSHQRLIRTKHEHRR